MSMQFWTKLVKHRVDLRLRLSQAGGILFIASFGIEKILEQMGASAEPATVLKLTGLGVAIVGWILRKGKTVKPVITDIDIIVSREEIRVGDERLSGRRRGRGMNKGFG